jgi:hypothetical protein
LATVKLSSQYNWPQFTDSDGLLLSGGKIYTYAEDSTSVKQTTYTTVEGNVPNPNPIVLDSSGRLPNPIWLVDGQRYNIVVKNNQDQLVTSQNRVAGVVPATTGNIGLAPIYNDRVFRSNNGEILANGKVYTYATNTFTLKQTAYTNNSQGNTVALANPITLTAQGTLPSPLYLTVGKKYNIVLTEPNGTTILQTTDPVQPIPSQYYTSAIYPFSYLDNIRAVSGRLQNGQMWGLLTEEIGGSSLLESGELINTIVYVPYTMQIENIAASSASLQSGTLVTIVNPVPYTMQIENISGSSLLNTGTLVVTINYVTSTFSIENISASSGLESGTLI